MKKIFAGLALSFFLCTPCFADATDQQPVLTGETNVVNSENTAMESTESEALLPGVLLMASISLDNDEAREVHGTEGYCAWCTANCTGSPTGQGDACYWCNEICN